MSGQRKQNLTRMFRCLLISILITIRKGFAHNLGGFCVVTIQVGLCGRNLGWMGSRLVASEALIDTAPHKFSICS